MNIATYTFFSVMLVVSWPFYAFGSDLSVDMQKVRFADGRPFHSEIADDLRKILSSEDTRALESVLRALLERPDLGVEVMGFADKNECRPSDCRELSLRRAKVIVDWLKSNGVKASQLKGPKGESTDWPVDDAVTNSGREFNRRVQFEPFLVKTPSLPR
ncbi:MAG: hypothetical protein AMXMBFR59_00830 [Rhodanobacteraceae bacterium]